jgi:hypothetical protein
LERLGCKPDTATGAVAGLGADKNKTTPTPHRPHSRQALVSYSWVRAYEARSVCESGEQHKNEVDHPTTIETLKPEHVALPDAFPHPGAVVIKLFNTAFAVIAVVCPWGLVNLTGITPTSVSFHWRTSISSDDSRICAACHEQE